MLDGVAGLTRTGVARLPNRPLGAVHLIADLDVLDELLQPLERIRQLLEAGLPSLQFRAPGRPFEERLRRAREIAQVARHARAGFVVNGDVELALALGADGVHVPARAADPAAIRALLPAGSTVGASCHDAAEMARARGCDWAFVSPIFASRSKPGTPPLGADGFTKLAAGSGAACYALGGITSERVVACFDAGAAGVAGIRGLLGQNGEAMIRAAIRAAADRDLDEK
jgi:thiamine-phosphate diphosphorylase